MTNSSPPSRATVSPSRTQASEALRHAAQKLVADRVSERVVDDLEAVNVQIQDRQLLPAPVRLRESDRQPIVQE